MLETQNASGHPGNDTGGNAHIAENRIEGGFREAAKSLFDDQMLSFLWLQVIDDLRPPRPLDTMRAVTACRLDSDTPIWKGGVRVVGLQHMRQIHHRPFGCPECIRQSLYIRDSSDQKRHVDTEFGMLPSDVTEVAIPMQKIVLHIHDDQGGFANVWTIIGCLHQCLPKLVQWNGCIMRSQPAFEAERGSNDVEQHR